MTKVAVAAVLVVAAVAVVVVDFAKVWAFEILSTMAAIQVR